MDIQTDIRVTRQSHGSVTTQHRYDKSTYRQTYSSGSLLEVSRLNMFWHSSAEISVTVLAFALSGSFPRWYCYASFPFLSAIPHACIFYSLLLVPPAGVWGSNEALPPLSFTGQPLDGAPFQLSLLPSIRVSGDSGRPLHTVVVDVFTAVSVTRSFFLFF